VGNERLYDVSLTSTCDGVFPIVYEPLACLGIHLHRWILVLARGDSLLRVMSSVVFH
jgi:hypothetical protein